jgi:lysyl-tRNA synthetase class 2
MSTLWQPTASINALRERAAIIRTIRAFFHARNVLEVETPSLSSHTVTDPYIEAMSTQHTEPGASDSAPLYLQTSPEYAMKRLLAAGSGDIFQIGKAFRDDEVGRLHNPEFTMLEWYRVGFSMQTLIDEVAALLVEVLPIAEVEQFTYCELFERILAFNPLTIHITELLSYCNSCGLGDYAESLQANIQVIQASDNQLLLKDGLLQVIFSQQIESQIGELKPAIVTHFPASQASLATLTASGQTANRFEVYFKGIELANGFNELTDASEQRNRFEQDNQKRKALGLSVKPIDSYFLQALSAGLPKCSGVALGIDRLVMLACNKTSVGEVISFSHLNC